MQQAPVAARPRAARDTYAPFVEDDSNEPVPLVQLGAAWLRLEGTRAVAAGVVLRASKDDR